MGPIILCLWIQDRNWWEWFRCESSPDEAQNWLGQDKDWCQAYHSFSESFLLFPLIVNQTVCEKRGDVEGKCERLRLLVWGFLSWVEASHITIQVYQYVKQYSYAYQLCIHSKYRAMGSLRPRSICNHPAHLSKWWTHCCYSNIHQWLSEDCQACGFERDTVTYISS